MKNITMWLTLGTVLTLAGASDAFAVNFINQKVCSAVDPSGPFRDTVIAGAKWTATTCAQYAAAIGAQYHQLGCITKTGFVFGISGVQLPVHGLILATPPNPNCGWVQE